MGRKHCGKRRNCSLQAIFPFPRVFSKDFYCQHVKTRACLGKGYGKCINTHFFPSKSSPLMTAKVVGKTNLYFKELIKKKKKKTKTCDSHCGKREKLLVTYNFLPYFKYLTDLTKTLTSANKVKA